MYEKKNVYRINGKLFVARNVENAIRMFREVYPFPDDVDSVEAVRDDQGFSLAYVESNEYELKYEPKDRAMDPGYMESLTLSNEPIPTEEMIDGQCVCKELPPDFIVRDDDYPF